MNEAEEISEEVISDQCKKRGIKEIKVFKDDLEDARMQNIVLLANIDRYHLIPEIQTEHYNKAMEDLMGNNMLKNNMKLFQEERG